MARRPSESWTGRWISVIGLVEPPYEGAHYGRAYRNVGITVILGNQIAHISEREAKFRLGRGVQVRPRSIERRSSRNTEILGGIRAGVGTQTTTPTHGIAPVTLTPQSRNHQILHGLTATVGARNQSYPLPPTPVGPQSHGSPYPSVLKTSSPVEPLKQALRWVWGVGGIFILLLLLKGILNLASMRGH
jgi:hypothetical protein